MKFVRKSGNSWSIRFKQVIGQHAKCYLGKDKTNNDDANDGVNATKVSSANGTKEVLDNDEGCYGECEHRVLDPYVHAVPSVSYVFHKASNKGTSRSEEPKGH